MTESQAAATRFCARVIGPLLLIVGAVVVARFDALALILPALFQNAALVFITGVFTLIVGLVLFTAHHHWSSAAAIAVSLLGLLTIVRGLVLLTIPDLLAAFATNALRAAPSAVVVGAIAMLLGLWLSYAGWFTRARA